jgi:hypothetical protein
MSEPFAGCHKQMRGFFAKTIIARRKIFPAGNANAKRPAKF